MPFKNPHPLYSIWRGIKRRCLNKNCKQWKDYGGRGIQICDRWKNSFQNFISDMEPRPKGCEIDRINNNGHYEPNNCHWISHKENQRNQRRTIIIDIQGQKFKAIELSEKTGMKVDTIVNRANQGLSLKQILNKKRRVYYEGLKLGGKANGIKKRALKFCKNGHRFTKKNTKITKEGWRSCRRCHANRSYGRPVTS